MEKIKSDRDAIVFLGLLTHAYLTWDPPVPAGNDQYGKPDFTHFSGLNIHSLMVDNIDGEVLALEKNEIHQEENPLAHAEQRTIRTAIEKIKNKRPRGTGTTVENWYRNELFYREGNNPEDFISKGTTLYTTLEPCPFCTSALCVSRVKRIVFLIPDGKFGGSWDFIKNKFYQKYELQYEKLEIDGSSDVCKKAKDLHKTVFDSIISLKSQSIQDTWFLDYLHTELSKALTILSSLKSDDLCDGASREINMKTLKDLKKLCKLP